MPGKPSYIVPLECVVRVKVKHYNFSDKLHLLLIIERNLILSVKYHINIYIIVLSQNIWSNLFCQTIIRLSEKGENYCALSLLLLTATT